MAVTAYLSDGTATAQLNDGTAAKILVGGFAPRTPEPVLYEIEDSGSDGRELAASVYPNVTEEIHVKFLGGTPASRATARANRDAVKNLLDQAHDRVRNPALATVYFYFKEDAADSLWQAEVLAGHFQMDDDNLDGAGKYNASIITGTLTFVRWPEFSVSGASMVMSETIANTGEPLAVTASNEGDVATPTILHAHNADAPIGSLYLGHTTAHEPESLCVQFGAAADRLHPRIEKHIGDWDLSAKHVTASGGRYVYPLARIEAMPADTRCYWVLASHGMPIWKSMTFTPRVQSVLTPLGYQFQLPPWQTHGRTQGALTLSLSCMSVSGGKLILNALYLLPADTWRQLRPLGMPLAGARLVDDPFLGVPSIEKEGIQIGRYRALGSTINLRPARTEALFALWEGAPQSRLGMQMGYRSRKVQF